MRKTTIIFTIVALAVCSGVFVIPSQSRTVKSANLPLKQARQVEPEIGKPAESFQRFDPSNEPENGLRVQQDTSMDKTGPFRLHDGTSKLKHQQLNLGVPNLRTIPYWSDYFDYHGLRYTYKMVGSDPKRGSATTVIPVEIIPLRWVFSNGMVVDASTDIVDGQTPVQGIINSPIFQDYDFTSGGTHVGTTQYGDAFQRANFWDSVSTRSPDYHVRLAPPTVLPTQTVVVPDDKVEFHTLPSGFIYPSIDGEFVVVKEFELITALGIAPDSLPIMVWGSAGSENGAGYHNSYQTGNSIQTYISTTYVPGYAFGYLGNVSAISHEILEWMDDPLNDNFSAGWNDPFYINPPPPLARCDSYYKAVDGLEVADPFESLGSVAYTPVELNGSTYHMAEGAFIDFFTRNGRSRSVNGQYSFFEVGRQLNGSDTPPSTECVSSLHTENEFFTVPGSIYTFAYGMNNTGSVVGFYVDAAGTLHGFRKDRSGYTTLDFPGALRTIPRDINDGGTIVGNYRGSDLITHGFSYENGRFTTIDFPGSTDTRPEKINSQGVIVGVYDFSQPIAHGFVLDSRGFEVVDFPFGTNSEASSINDLGTIAGNSWIPGPTSGFIQTRRSLTRFDLPDAGYTVLKAINNFGDLGGFFGDTTPLGSTGFVRLFGYPYVTQLYPFIDIVSDVNGNREILGEECDIYLQCQPFIGRPVLARGE